MNKILNLLLVLLILAYLGYRFYISPKFSNGAEIPNFSAPLIDGTSFSISDLKGDYVLLDFWGSWCPPCRQDNPNLVKLYDQYENAIFDNGGGFEIVSVSIETSEKPWKRAIEKDGLRWKYHIVQTERFKSEIPMAYGVKEIPTKYLLNPQGKIIAVNPDNEKVKSLLNPRLRKD